MAPIATTVLIFVAAIALSSTGYPQRPAGSFAVVLERDGTRWSATCESGCDFKFASTTVLVGTTPMRLDALGIRTAISDHPTAANFAIVLMPRGRGWTATSHGGTAWTELALDCPSSPCQARVTDLGVSGMSADR